MLLVKKINSGVVLFVLSVIFVSVLVGGLAAVMPIGFYLRLSLPFVAMGILFLAWAICSERNVGFPGVIYAGLLLLVALSVLWPRYIFIHKAGLPGVNPFTLLTMGMLALIMVQLLAVPTYARRVHEVFRAGGAVAVLVLVWFAWRVLATAFGNYPLAQEIDLFKEIVYIGSFFLFALVLGAHQNGPRDVLRVLVLCGLIVGCIGLLEGFMYKNPFVGLISMTGADNDTARTLAGIASDKIREGTFRAQSTFGHPIVFAQFVAALVPLSLYCLVKDPSKLWKTVGFLAIPIAIAAIAKSGSRAGIVSVAAACFVVGFVLWLRALKYGKITKVFAIFSLPAFLIVLILSVIVVSELAGGRTQHEVSSSTVRLVMLNMGVDALRGSPLVGFGQGMALSKAGVVGAGGVVTLDNYYINLALDFGYTGLFLYVLFVVLFVSRAVAFAVNTPGADGFFVGVLMSGVVALVSGFFVLSINDGFTLLWLLIGLCFSCFKGGKGGGQREA